MGPTQVKIHLMVHFLWQVSLTEAGSPSAHPQRSNNSLFSVDDNQGLEEPLGETLDPTDVVDVHAFKELTGSINLSSRMAIDHLSSNSLLGVLEGPELQTNHTEAATFKTGSTVIIDWFPFHGAGTPIPGIP
jgi:hypothetical protein